MERALAIIGAPPVASFKIPSAACASRPGQFKLSKLQNNYWIGEKSRRGRLMPAALWGTRPW
jgi:hypothetical protein